MLPARGAGVQGAGVGIAGIDSVGDVHPDPYWSNYILGNVRVNALQRNLGKILGSRCCKDCATAFPC